MSKQGRVEMTIRDMTESDVPGVARCHLASWQVAFRGILTDRLLDELSISRFETTWRRILTRPHRTNRIALSKTEILGFAAFGPQSDDPSRQEGTGEIHGIYVHPDHWRTGIGGRLLKSAFEQIAELGWTRAILWTMTDNAISRRFYEKEGMTLTGRTRTSERQSEFFEEVEYMKRIDARTST